LRNSQIREVPIEPMLQPSAQSSTGVLAFSHRQALAKAAQARAQLVCVIL
jgi:hypothetical protein